MSDKPLLDLQQFTDFWTCPMMWRLKHVENLQPSLNGYRAVEMAARQAVLAWIAERVTTERVPPFDYLSEKFAQFFDELALLVSRWNSGRHQDMLQHQGINALREFHRLEGENLAPINYMTTIRFDAGNCVVKTTADILEPIQLMAIRAGWRPSSSRYISRMPKLALLAEGSGIGNVSLLEILMGDWPRSIRRRFNRTPIKKHRLKLALSSTYEAMQKGCVYVAPMSNFKCNPEYCDYWGHCPAGKDCHDENPRV